MEKLKEFAGLSSDGAMEELNNEINENLSADYQRSDSKTAHMSSSSEASSSFIKPYIRDDDREIQQLRRIAESLTQCIWNIARAAGIMAGNMIRWLVTWNLNRNGRKTEKFM